MKRPNILVFMTDHQRGDTVLPGHPCLKPNLDRFARQGVTFTRAFCPSPHCCPSRATFHSGLYPSRHGVWNNVCNSQALSRGLTEGVRLWGQDLAEAGYRLVWSGKWHVSSLERPRDRGWEELLISGYKPDEHGSYWPHYEAVARQEREQAAVQREGGRGRSRGMGQILRPGYGTYALYGSYDQRPPGHDEQAVELAVEALPRLAAGKDPWAIFVGLVGPHDPYVVPRRLLDLYDADDVPLPPSYADSLADKPRVYRRMRDMRFGQLGEREVREAIMHFWAYCSYLDESFGRLLAAIDAAGKAENTLVLYCSDHGDYCGDHGLFAKGIPCFQGAYHVPAVIRWPAGVASPGRQAHEFVTLADFAPTFVELAGAAPRQAYTGRSLVPFIRGLTPNDWPDEVHTQCDGVELYYTQRSVRTEMHKYVFNGFDDDELYDLAADPHEMVNRAADPAYDPVKRQLVRRMWRFARRENDAAINAYITVSLAPWGPAEALADDGQS